MRRKNPAWMKEILGYIGEYFLLHNATPSTRQIAEAVGVASGTVYKYLVAMDKQGMISYRDGRIATESLQKLAPEREEVLALGTIACGEANEETENLLYKTFLPTAIFGQGPFYILYATGDSMEDAGIEEGDILVIRKDATPHKGDILVALDENNENTLKRYGGLDPLTHKVRLEYQNQAVYGDKVILVNQLTCQGVLSHVIKEK